MMLERIGARFTYVGEPFPKRKEKREQTSHLKEWLDTRGIKAVLLDLDDTLLDTHTLVERQKDVYKAYLHDRIPTLDPEMIDSAVEQADLDVYATHSVSIGRWIALGSLVAKRLPGAAPDICMDGVSLLVAMYATVPDVFPGAYDAVSLFRDTGTTMGLVTHADPGWTELKLNRTGLGGFFDHIEIIDEHGYKGSDSWAKAIEALGVKPSEVLVIGDSLSGDIRASREAGVTHIVALPSPWVVYRRGDVPEGVISASGIGAVVETLLKDQKE